MTDVVTPNFHERIAQGEIINNPLDASVITRTVVPSTVNLGWYTDSTRKHIATVDGTFVGIMGDLLEFTSESNTIRDQAVTEAYSRANDQASSLLVTLGEYKETQTMLIHTLQRVVNLLYAMKRRKLKLLKLNEYTPTGLWMEYRYGWRPLVSDVQGIIKAFKNRHVLRAERQTYRGYVAHTEFETDLIASPFSTSHFNPIKRTCEVKTQARAGVLCALQELNDLEYWGITNLPGALWDLTRLSFVVDWFFNVGETIASWTPSLSSNCLASWVVVKQVTTQRNTYTGNTSTINNLYFGNYGGGKVEKITEKTVRTPNPSRQIMPSLKLNLNEAKFIDLGIIGRQLVSGIVRTKAKRPLTRIKR
jgi:hypothetical protein